MEYPVPLISARLIRRYKRFLADVELESGEVITVHCPNTGSMLRCDAPGSRVWLFDSQNPQRKYRFGWEWVEVDQQFIACINPTRANHLVAEAIHHGVIPCSDESDINGLQSEPKVVDGRLDFWLPLKNHADRGEFIEVKSVTLKVDEANYIGAFPDAKTDRGVKHLKRLASLVEQGFAARLIFCVMHEGIKEVQCAMNIDPVYAEQLSVAAQQGVAIEAYRVQFDHQPEYSTMKIIDRVPFIFP